MSVELKTNQLKINIDTRINEKRTQLKLRIIMSLLLRQQYGIWQIIMRNYNYLLE